MNAAKSYGGGKVIAMQMQQKSYRLIVGIAGLWLAGITRALPVLPVPALPLALGPAAGQVSTQATDYYMYWDGREMMVLEGGADVGVTKNIAVGASVQQTHGHGHDSANTYKSSGWNLHEQLTLLPEEGPQPAILLQAEQATDDVQLNSNTVSLIFSAAPQATTQAWRLVASKSVGRLAWQAYAETMAVNVNGEKVANVNAIGGGIAFPLRQHLAMSLSLTGFGDDYQGRHYTYQGEARVTYQSSAHSRLLFSADLFPRGIPLSGTPMSNAAAVGVVYGGSATEQFRTSRVGYVSLAGQVEF